MRKQHAKVSCKYNRRSRVKSGKGGEEGEKEPKEEMTKDKGVAVATDEVDDKSDDPSLRPFRFASRNASSKYDFVKVKVWLGDNADHYYVLSRFLLSRMLTVTKIPNHVAIKIALELKKLLIDNSLLDVSQNDLEANLFKLMERRGYGEEYINRYKMMTRFHHQRVPLVILVCGTACTGKSTIATQLAQRLNLPNVLQTDMVYELLRTSTDAPLTSTPVWAREFDSSEEFITEFCRECRIVRKGLAGDLKKAMKDGKPIIIEGTHLDPSIYLMDDDNKLPMKMQPKVEGAEVSSDLSRENSACHIQKQPADNSKLDSGSRSPCAKNTSSEEQVSCDQKHEILRSLASVNIEDKVSDDKVGTLKETKMDENPQTKKQRSGAEPIIVPIVLKMAEFDHEALLEEWIPTRTFSDNSIVKDKNKLMKNLKVIQDYLCSFESQGLTVVNISATTFPQTLDWLHSYLLQCIEDGISSVSTPKQQAQN